jgi:hypothetical protein
MYSSGWQASNAKRELAVIKAGAIRWRCFSFASVFKIPGLPYYLPHAQGAVDACIKHKIPIMFDSGVFGYRSYKLSLLKQKKDLSKLVSEDQFIQLYVDYIKKNGHLYDWFVTVDLDKVAEDIYNRHCKLEAMGIRPTPVFHGDDSAAEYLRRYHDLGHTLVCAGTATGRSGQKMQKHYLDEIFNLAEKFGMRLHGLALTSPFVMLGWNWWSVDSSSWSRAAGYGSIFVFDENTHRMSTYHISDRSTKGEVAKMNPALVERVREQVEAEGYDFDIMRQIDGEDAFVLRHIWNGKQMLKLTDYATKLHGEKSGNWNFLI